MGMEEDLICTPEAYIIVLTNITPNKLNDEVKENYKK